MSNLPSTLHLDACVKSPSRMSKEISLWLSWTVVKT